MRKADRGISSSKHVPEGFSRVVAGNPGHAALSRHVPHLPVRPGEEAKQNQGGEGKCDGKRKIVRVKALWWLWTSG